MIFRLLAPLPSRLATHWFASLSVCLAALPLLPVQAQGLKPSSRSSSTPAPLAVPATPRNAPVRQADFIVAIVNSEPITNHQVRAEVQRSLQQLSQQGRPAPDTNEVASLVLERLINERAQLHYARENGIKIDEPSVDQAVQTVARQNKLELPELKRRLTADGLEFNQFREQLRDQLMLTRLREREVEPRVRVGDQDVDQYLKEQQDNSSNPVNLQINLAQILIIVPEGASPAQVTSLQAKAQQVHQRARAGEDFATLARETSDSPDRANGGLLGLRTADRYPQLFVDAIASLSVDGLSGLVRSGAGFHILKVIEKRSVGLPPTTVTQNRARHILLRPGPQLTEAAAVAKLSDFRKRILAGQGDFATLARDNSQDGSSAKGGDLGWANPGQFVPEFEAVINQLAPGDISEPLISRFGVHLIQLMDQRSAPLDPRDQREMVRNLLREKKLDEAYGNWARDIRGRAYVEMRDAPQ